MSRPAAFVGAFTAANPNAPGQPMVARIALPRGEFDAFLGAVGFPRYPDGPAVAVLPCARPVHPVRDADVIALAAARALDAALGSGEVQLTLEIVRALDALAMTVDVVVGRWERQRGIDPNEGAA